MRVVDIPMEELLAAPWNANEMDPAMLGRLKESVTRYGLVQNLVVRPTSNDNFEVLSGNQRLRVLRQVGYPAVPCVVVDLDDAHARLLAQALNRIQGEDDLGLKAELVREVLAALPQEEVLNLLPETAESLQSLATLGQETMAGYLKNWQRAQAARLKHLTLQLTPSQMEIVEEVLARYLPRDRDSAGGNPNARGVALFNLCQEFLANNGDIHD